MSDWTAASMVVTPPIWGRAIFAEDARFEINGLFSLIGIFSSPALGFVEFPSSMPKLAICTEIITPTDAEPLNIHLRLYLPGSDIDSPYWEEQLAVTEQAAAAAAETEEGGVLIGQPIRRYIHVAVHAGVPIERPGRIQVRALVGNSVLPLGSLDARKLEVTPS